MGSIGRFQESLELLRQGMDLMVETAPPLLQQQAQAEVSLASLLSFMGETKRRLAAFEERERVREARLAAVETNLSKALSSLFPRVDSLLSQLERKEQQREKINSVPSKEVLQENFSVASTSRETRENNQTASDSPVKDMKKKQDKAKANNTSASALGPATSPTPSIPSAATAATQDKINKVLLHAANEGNVNELHRALASGANINCKSSLGKTPLSIAALQGYNECVVELINANADISAEDADGLTALHLAASRGKDITLRSLLDSTDIDVDVTSPNDQTALTLAAKFGHKKCILILLEYSADTDTRDCDGKTPLHHAVINNNIECVTALLEWGADLYTLDDNEKSPMCYAFESNNRALQESILSITDSGNN